MNRLLFLAIILFSGFNLSAQIEQTEYYYHIPKSSTLSFGVGFPSTTQIAVEIVGLIDQDAKATPQFTLRYEYAINENIGIGAYGGFYSGETENISLPMIQLDSILNDPGSILGNLIGGNGPSTRYTVNVFTLGGHLTYHLYRFEKLDTYTILRGGFNFISVKEDGIRNTDFIGAQVPMLEYFAGAGIRYYFTPNLALYGEIGNSILSPVHINAGATWRF